MFIWRAEWHQLAFSSVLFDWCFSDEILNVKNAIELRCLRTCLKTNILWILGSFAKPFMVFYELPEKLQSAWYLKNSMAFHFLWIILLSYFLDTKSSSVFFSKGPFLFSLSSYLQYSFWSHWVRNCVCISSFYPSCPYYTTNSRQWSKYSGYLPACIMLRTARPAVSATFYP